MKAENLVRGFLKLKILIEGMDKIMETLDRMGIELFVLAALKEQ